MKSDAARSRASRLGRWVYHFLPLRRRIVLANLHRVFGATLSEPEIVGLAQAHYAHLARSFLELLRFSFMSVEQRLALARVDNVESCVRAHAMGKGVLILTGHLGNFEVATACAIGHFAQYRGQLHVLRRPISPRWIERLLRQRFRAAGLEVLPKKGALDTLLDRLERGDAIVFVMDQHAAGRDGVRVDFFGHAAGTLRSLAVIALKTGAPVVPMSTWREPDGRHVVRFEEPLPTLASDDPGEAIRINTRAYNAELERLILRHPEQWYWVHRRWKDE
jgi:lauroyl/myristoyl acyltransferase